MDEIKNLLIEGTNKTPQIELDYISGELIFTGKSIPENAAKVYEPVFSWVEKYVKVARPTTNIRFDLEYFNTSSLLWLTKILKELSRINEPDFVILLNLYLPVEEYDEINEFDDLKDAFLPISSVLAGAIPCIGIKIYGKDDNSEVIKNTMLFIETEQLLN